MRRAVPKLLQPARWVPGLALRMAAAVATQVTAWFAALFMAIVVGNIVAFAVMAMFASSARAATEFLDPEVAFKVSGKALDDRRIELRFDVASGYHLYRDRFSAAAEPASVSLEALQMPAGEMEFDAAQQKKVAVFRQPVTLLLPLSAVPTAKFWLQVVNQGCADQGLCYPPQTHSFDITPAGAPGAALLVRAVADEASASQPTSLATRGAVGAGVYLEIHFRAEYEAWLRHAAE